MVMQLKMWMGCRVEVQGNVTWMNGAERSRAAGEMTWIDEVGVKLKVSCLKDTDEGTCTKAIIAGGRPLQYNFFFFFFSIKVFACKQWTQNSRLLIQMCPEA